MQSKNVTLAGPKSARALLVSGVAASGLILASVAAALAEIPAARLFRPLVGNWNHTLSHDGSRMIVTRQWSGGQAIDVIDADTGRPHGLAPRRFLRASWGSSNNIVYANDRMGRVLRVAVDRVEEAKWVDLAPLAGWQAVRWPTPDHPFLMVRALKERNRLYRCDPRPEISGRAKCESVADGAPSLDNRFEWLLTADGRAAARLRLAPSGRFAFEAPDTEGSWEEVFVFDAGTWLSLLGPVRPDGTVWALSNRGRDRQAVVVLDVRTGAEKVFHRDARFDVRWANLAADDGRPLVAFSDPGYQKIRYFDDRARRAFEALYREVGRPAQLGVISGDRAGRYLTVPVFDERVVRAEYLLDLEAGSARRLSVSSLAVPGGAFSSTEPVDFEARDGRRIFGYLTRPLRVGAIRPPMLLMLHGGPWLRYLWSYDATTQFFASRGFSVLKLNYRGSAGYNRGYGEAARGKFPDAVLDDIRDAVEWAYDRGHAERGKVALYGPSFGGFLVLAALARDPEVFAAGIAVNPIADAVAFWKRDWRHPGHRALWQHWFGSPDFPGEVLAATSPLLTHGGITAPVLLVAGLKDKRVPATHLQRLHNRLMKAGKTSQLIAYKHGRHAVATFGTSKLIEMHESMLGFLQRHVR